MKDTFIEYKDDKGFWIATSFAEILNHYVLESMQNNLKDKPKWYLDMYSDLELNLKGYDRSNFGWNIKRRLEYVHEREIVFLNLLNKTKKALKKEGKFISIEIINSIFDKMDLPEREKPKFVTPIKVKSLLGTIEIIVKMIHNDWAYDNKEIFFEGLDSAYREGNILL